MYTKDNIDGVRFHSSADSQGKPIGIEYLVDLSKAPAIIQYNNGGSSASYTVKEIVDHFNNKSWHPLTPLAVNQDDYSLTF